MRDVTDVAEALWAEAQKRREEYPDNGYGIEYVNGFEDAATLVDQWACKDAHLKEAS